MFIHQPKNGSLRLRKLTSTANKYGFSVLQFCCCCCYCCCCFSRFTLNSFNTNSAASQLFLVFFSWRLICVSIFRQYHFHFADPILCYGLVSCSCTHRCEFFQTLSVFNLSSITVTCNDSALLAWSITATLVFQYGSHILPYLM